MTELRTKYTVGQLVHHRLFQYRGVVVDVDPEYALSDQWYEEVAQTRPPRDQPWYRVLVDGSDQVTYVAERNLDADETGIPIQHPLLNEFFNEFRQGYYSDTRNVN
jgi:heat shock protein HspQ